LQWPNTFWFDLEGDIMDNGRAPVNAVGKRRDWSSLWRLEDWWAVWLGFAVIALACIGWLVKPVLANSWGGELGGILTSLTRANLPNLLIAGALGLVLFTLAVFFTDKKQWLQFATGFPLVFLLAVAASVLGNYGPWRHYGFNEVVWALVLGLLISNILKVPQFIKAALRTELYIKTGLVLLGASILFNRIMVLGLKGLGVSWLVVPLVLVGMYWFSQRVLKMHDDKEMAITIAAATAVCGVSAAIAAGTASKAKKEDISIAVSISLIFTILMMIGMPLFIKAVGMSSPMAGAWIGGTVDSTGAVVAAGSMVDQEAMEVASVIKMIQNLLIGVIAFAIAFFWVSVYEKDSKAGNKVGISEIWRRLPKFVVGFIAASLLFSFVIPEQTVNSALSSINAYREFFFTLAFISIGLESNIISMAKSIKGGKPVILYVAGQTLNLVATFFAAWLFFGGVF
jgi:uncharacterized integral membrane protein (TIGR00698 family)